MIYLYQKSLKTFDKNKNYQFQLLTENNKNEILLQTQEEQKQPIWREKQKQYTE